MPADRPDRETMTARETRALELRCDALAANVEALRAELAAVRARLAGKIRPGRRRPPAGPLIMELKAGDGRERAS